MITNIYPYNLILEIVKEDPSFELDHLVTKENLEIALNCKDISDIERLIYKLRYEELKTYEEISERFAFTRQRVYSICKRLTRKINQKIRKLVKNTSKSDIIKNFQIEDLDLSIRSYNALRNADLDDLDFLLENYMSFDKLKRVKGLGAKGAREVLEKIEALFGKSEALLYSSIKKVLTQHSISKENLIKYIEETF